MDTIIFCSKFPVIDKDSQALNEYKSDAKLWLPVTNTLLITKAKQFHKRKNEHYNTKIKLYCANCTLDNGKYIVNFFETIS